MARMFQDGPARWFYDLGAPEYQARALGAYYRKYGAGRDYYTVKSEMFREGSAYLRFYGHCAGRHLSAMCDECRTFASFGE